MTPQARDATGSLRGMGRHVAVYTVGTLVNRAAAIVMLPVYTRYLTPADYGVLQLIEVTLDVIATVAGSRLGAGIFALYHKAEGEDAQRTVLASAFVALLAVFSLAAAASWFAAPLVAGVVLGDAAFTGMVRIAALSLAFQGLLFVPLDALQLEERSTTVVGFNLYKTALQIGLNVLFLVGLGYGARGVLLSTLIANAVSGVPLAVSFVRRVGFAYDGAAFRAMARLGVPLIGVQLARFVMTFGDRYFLRVVRDTATVGVYSLGYQFGTLLYQIGNGPFMTAWEPKRFEVAKRPDADEVFSRVFLYFNLVLFTVGVGISLFVGDVLHVLTTPAFYGAAAIVPVILVAYIAQSWANFHNYGLFAGGRTEYITLANWVGAAVALAGYALLIPRWLGMGAAVATVLSFAVSDVVVYVFAQRVHRVGYRWGPVVQLAFVAVGVCVAGALLPAMPLVASIGTHSALLVVYAALVWWGGVLGADDRARLRDVRFSPRAAVAQLTR